MALMARPREWDWDLDVELGWVVKRWVCEKGFGRCSDRQAAVVYKCYGAFSPLLLTYSTTQKGVCEMDVMSLPTEQD